MHPAVISRTSDRLPVLMTAGQFADCFKMAERAARKVFLGASQGKLWRGYTLPVIGLPGNRGGAGGSGLWRLTVATLH